MIAVAFVLVAGMAHAQTLYKCTSKDGKISFSDIPCPRDARSTAQEQKGTADPGVIGDAKARVARALGLPAGGISFQNVRVVTREGGFPDPHVCGEANGRRFIAAPADALAPFIIVEGDSSLTTFLNTWNGKCAGAKGEARISNDEGRFEEFKEALASQNDLLALVVMGAADGNIRQRMQAHAEGLCARGDRTACLMLDCPGRTLNDEVFHSRKCAQRMGRAYGDGWVESKFWRRSNWVEYSIKCTNRRSHVSVWCTQPRTECRRGMWTGRPEHVHGEPASLEQVAAKECSR